MLHKFKVRQNVRMLREGFSDNLVSSAEIFEVVKLMPEDRAGEATYRIRSRAGERAVREGEITAVG